MVCVGPRPHLVFGSSIDGRTAVNSPQRVSDLLDVSRPTIDRMADDDLSTALRDPHCLRGRGRVWPRPPAAGVRPRNGRRRASGYRRRPVTNTTRSQPLDVSLARATRQ